VAQLNALGMEYDDSDIELRKRLLKRKIAIAREKHIKFQLSRFQQHSILQTGPAHLRNRSAMMPHQRSAKPPVKTLINQDTHLWEKG